MNVWKTIKILMALGFFTIGASNCANKYQVKEKEAVPIKREYKDKETLDKKVDVSWIGIENWEMKDFSRTANGYEIIMQGDEPRTYKTSWQDLKEESGAVFSRIILPVDNKTNIKVYNFKDSKESVTELEREDIIIYNTFANITINDDQKCGDTEELAQMLDLYLLSHKYSTDNKKAFAKKILDNFGSAVVRYIQGREEENSLKFRKVNPKDKKPSQFLRTTKGYKFSLNGVELGTSYEALLPSDNSGEIFITRFDDNEKSFAKVHLKRLNDDKDVMLRDFGPKLSLDRNDKESEHLVDVLDSLLLNFYDGQPSEDQVKYGCELISRIEKMTQKFIEGHYVSIFSKEIK